jgi:hypothetical protein
MSLCYRPNVCLIVEPAQNFLFRDQLRSARAIALADAEGFHAVLRTVVVADRQWSATDV